jgi:hypothetical protein
MPYRLHPPTVRGDTHIDCSLYVILTYEDVGLPFPKGVRTAEQIRQATVKIDWDQVLPGDLLFFEKTYQSTEAPGPDGRLATHIGISLGAGTRKMWNSKQPVVEISSLDNWPTLFEARRHPGIPTAQGAVLNTDGENIRPILEQVSAKYGLPLWFVLACAIAESGLNRYAERWDGLTPLAKKAIQEQDWTTLQSIIDRSGEDISFSYGQQTLQLFVPRPYTVDEALSVRTMLFSDPVAAIDDMTARMQQQLLRATNEGAAHLWRTGGDPYLAALLFYNSGTYWMNDAYWTKYAGNVANYKGAIRRAKELVGEV